MENIRIYICTYNVGCSTPEQELNDLLDISQNADKHEKLPDFFVLSFQEVKAQPQNMLLDAIFDDPWTNACKELLQTKDYIKFKTIRLQGLILNVFGLRKHLLDVREIESEYTRTGLSGMWGNKGAVSIRMSIKGCSICFVNSHLSAHDGYLKERVEDYNSIVHEQSFHVPEHTEIFFHDYVFWSGDLNFRLMEDYEKNAEEIERSILKKDLKVLFEHDQLRHVMKKGEAFSELTEKDPPFQPTFKYDVGTNSYNFKRRPAWCDRILYRVNKHNYENITLNVDQLSYKDHPFYTLSDHKPVTAEFEIKIPPVDKRVSVRASLDQVFSDYTESVVKFDEINSWNQDDENMVVYRMNPFKIPSTSEDWIGLFKEDYNSLDDYVCYEYASKCSTPTEDKPSDGGSSSLKYQLTFSELPSKCRGTYCLIYFSQSEDKVISVLGISKPFPVIKTDSD